VNAFGTGQSSAASGVSASFWAGFGCCSVCDEAAANGGESSGVSSTSDKFATSDIIATSDGLEAALTQLETSLSDSKSPDSEGTFCELVGEGVWPSVETNGEREDDELLGLDRPDLQPEGAEAAARCCFALASLGAARFNEDDELHRLDDRDLQPMCCWIL